MKYFAKRFASLTLALLLLLSLGTAPVLAAGGPAGMAPQVLTDYHPGDVAFINDLIAKGWVRKDTVANDPDAWDTGWGGFLRWDTSSPKRVCYLETTTLTSEISFLPLANLEELYMTTDGNNAEFHVDLRGMNKLKKYMWFPYDADATGQHKASVTLPGGGTVTINPNKAYALQRDFTYIAIGTFYFTQIPANSLVVSNKPPRPADFLHWEMKKGGTTTTEAKSLFIHRDLLLTETQDITVTPIYTTTPQAPAVTKVQFPQSAVRLVAGKAITLPAVAHTEDDSKAQLSYTSSKPKVATVNSKTGKITAKKAGTTTITAKAENGKTSKLKVTVLKKGTQAIKVEKVSAKVSKTMKVGQTKQITGKYTPAEAIGAKVTYSSNKKNVITIDSSGRMVAKKKGSAVITVKAGGKPAKYKVTVK